MVSVEEGVDASRKDVILDECALIEKDYGLPLNELYKLALRYYRGELFCFILLKFVNLKLKIIYAKGNTMKRKSKNYHLICDIKVITSPIFIDVLWLFDFSNERRIVFICFD